MRCHFFHVDTTLESCRLWLEVLFRQCGGILGTTGSICPLFWSHEHLSQRLPSLVTESVDRTSIVLCKDLLEQVIIKKQFVHMASCEAFLHLYASTVQIVS